MRHSTLAALLLGGFTALAQGRPAAADVRVRMISSGTEVSVANNFQVRVVVEGVSGKIDYPELEGEGFQVVNRTSGQSSRMTIVNGRQRQDASITFAYVLKPTRAGTIRIAPVKVEVGGSTYHSPAGLTIQVEPIQPQDHLIIELQGPERSIYVDQEFTVVLRVLARRLGGQYRHLDPFPSEGETWPRLSIPWFEGQEGFATEEFQSYAKGLIDPRGDSGFPINNFARRDFFNETPYRFKFRRGEEERTGSDGQAQPYFSYTLEKRFRAEKPGTYLLGAVLAKGYVFVDQRPQQPKAVAVIAQSEPLSVTVKAPPEEGRPPHFTGGVGRFEAVSEVKPSRVWVGEPLTLTVSIKGNGPLENVGPPALAAQEGFPALFRIHDEPRTGVTDAQARVKTFTYGIRPRSAQVKEVPPIRFAYFDPLEDKYVTVETSPLPIEVQEGKSGGEDFFAATREDGLKSQVQVLEPKLYQIYEEPDALEPAAPPRTFGPIHLAMLTAPPAISLAVLALVTRRRRLHADPALLRSRRARRRAVESLREAGAALGAGDGREVHAALARAVARLVGDRLGIPSAGMTAADAAGALRSAGLGEALVAEAREVFERADRARYGVERESGEDLSRRMESARGLLGKLDAALRPGRRG